MYKITTNETNSNVKQQCINSTLISLHAINKEIYKNCNIIYILYIYI